MRQIKKKMKYCVHLSYSLRCVYAAAQAACRCSGVRRRRTTVFSLLSWMFQFATHKRRVNSHWCCILLLDAERKLVHQAVDLDVPRCAVMLPPPRRYTAAAGPPRRRAAAVHAMRSELKDPNLNVWLCAIYFWTGCSAATHCLLRYPIGMETWAWSLLDGKSIYK